MNGRLRLASGRDEWAMFAYRPGGTVLHSWEWLSWIAPLVGCTFVPLIVEEQRSAVGIAPMLVRRRGLIGSANLVPFPFLGPLVPDHLTQSTGRLLVGWARRHGIARMRLGLYPGDDRPTGPLAAAGFVDKAEVTHLVSVDNRSSEEILASFDKKLRAGLRRGERRGLTVRASSDDELTRVLPALHQQAMHGLATHTARVGAALVSSRPHGIEIRCSTAVVDGSPAGVCVSLSGRPAIGWLMASDRQFSAYHPDSALAWDAIQWAHRNKSGALDLLTAPNPGIARYKQGFDPTLRTGTTAEWTSLSHRLGTALINHTRQARPSFSRRAHVPAR